MSQLPSLVAFTKMHAQGNDVVIIDALRQPFPQEAELTWGLWGQRHLGVGADHVAVIEAPRHPQANAFVRIVNADGSNSNHVMQVLRCVAAYAQRTHLLPPGNLWLETHHGAYKLWADPQGHLYVRWRLSETTAPPVLLERTTEEHPFEAWMLPLPTPHCVVRCDAKGRKALSKVIHRCRRLPGISFNTPITHLAQEGEQLKLNTYLPNFGWVKSSGEGSLAASWLCQHQNMPPHTRDDHLSWDAQHPGGTLHVRYQATKRQFTLSAPVTYVFAGHSLAAPRERTPVKETKA